MQYHKKVIPFTRGQKPQNSVWSFEDYAESGRSQIKSWYDHELSEEARLKFDTLLKNSAKIENHLHWGGFKQMKGKLAEVRVWQLDFKADRRQYRLHGVFRGSKKAVLLSGCFHKGDVYTPSNALNTAYERAKAVREGRAETIERQIKFNE